MPKSKKSLLSEYLLPLIPIAITAIIMAAGFDTYFQTNDDITMRNIVSGEMTGTPSAMAVFLEYPLALLLMGLYKLIPNVSWYGLFDLAVVWGSVYLVVLYFSKRFQDIKTKFYISLFVLCFFCSLIFNRFVVDQFTVVAGIAGAAGAVAFFLIDDKKDFKHFILESIPCVLFEVIAFCKRPNTLFLQLPIIGIMYLVKWIYGSKEAGEKCFGFKNLVKYFCPALAVVLLMILCIIPHKIAYSQDGWAEYEEYNVLRSSIMDYQGAPNYDDNKDFYDEIGWDKADYQIFTTFNTAFDDKIDYESMSRMADYNKDELGMSYFRNDFVPSVKGYGYFLFQYRDDLTYKYAYGIIALYLIALVLAIISKDKKMFIILPLIFIVRTLECVALIMRGRYLVRVHDPICYIECFVLLILIFMMLFKKKEKTKQVIVILCICAAFVPYLISDIVTTTHKSNDRKDIDIEWDVLTNYCERNPDKFYIIDIISSANYTEKVITKREGAYENYTIAGGWLCKNPLFVQKLSDRNISNVSEGLLDGKALFVVNGACDVNWIYDFYEAQGIEINLNLDDEVRVSPEMSFMVYSVIKK